MKLPAEDHFSKTTSVFDMALARKNLQARAQARDANLDARFEEAWNDFRAILELLIREYQPVRIYQWGSLLDRNKFSEISDIDIGIEGTLSPEQFFRMLTEADAMSRFPVHIVQMEHIEPEFREIILKKGKVVYERKERHGSAGG